MAFTKCVTSLFEKVDIGLAHLCGGPLEFARHVGVSSVARISRAMNNSKSAGTKRCGRVNKRTEYSRGEGVACRRGTRQAI
jgi:hypothetical protein